MRWALCLAAWIGIGTAQAASDAAPAIDVLHYAAILEPNAASGTVRGRESIDLVVRVASLRTFTFDAGALTVERVRVQGQPLVFAKQGTQLQVDLPGPVDAGTRLVLDIAYRGAPAHGLEFDAARGEAYTIFSTSQWLVCIDAPSERATLDLTLLLPAGQRSAGNGRMLSRTSLADGREAHRWRIDTPVPSFSYGFAAAGYREHTERDGPSTLHTLSLDQAPQALQRIFADTGEILRFFGDKAGLPYRGDYTQVLVADTIGQELAGAAFLSEAHGREVLDGTTDTGLIAHEAAHQWWGIRVTCRDWGHFWLNEGFAEFMSAAWLEHRLGRAAYDARVAAWKRRVDKLRADGADHALVYERWVRPSADDRAVVYRKGAYVLHLLRERLGERAFWAGIRAYTRANDASSVTTADFKRAMEASSGADLSAFFDEWVTGTP